MSEWFENERFWESTYEFMFPPARFERTDAEVAAIVALVGDPFRDVLDLGCGPGRTSIAFAARGGRVTGVDRSRFMLTRARERALAAGVAVEWVEEDMRRFVRPEAYDIVLSLFTSFGYFETEEENLGVLANARAALRSPGALVLELMSKERLAHVLREAGVETAPSGRLMIEHRRVLDGWERIENDWYLLDNGRYEKFTLRHFVYSARELRALLQRAGFSRVEIYGGFDGAPYIGDTRLHVVARP